MQGRSGGSRLRTGKAAAGSRHAVSATHAFWLPFARLDAVLLHAERPVDLRTKARHSLLVRRRGSRRNLPERPTIILQTTVSTRVEIIDKRLFISL